MCHPLDRQIFDGDQINTVHDTTAVLVREVAPSPGDPLMRACDDLAPCGALSCTQLFSGKPPLRFAKRPLLLAEEARVGKRLSSAEGSKRFHAHVNPYLLASFWQWRWFCALTGEPDIPLARAAARDRGRLGRSLDRAVQEHLDRSNAVETKAMRLGLQFAAHWRLRTGDTGVASLAAKECLKGAVNAYRDVLQHLRLRPRKGWASRFQRRQRRLLILETQRFLALFQASRRSASSSLYSQGRLLKLLFEEAPLLLVRVQTVLERLTHACIIT
jgi:hypothetical protein